MSCRTSMRTPSSSRTAPAGISRFAIATSSSGLSTMANSVSACVDTGQRPPTLDITLRRRRLASHAHRGTPGAGRLTAAARATTLRPMTTLTLDRAMAVNGLHLHYVEWGEASAPPIVLLHGITGHARTWDRLAAELAPERRVIALDQRGHGDSDAAPDRDYTVAAMAKDLADFVDQIGLRRFSASRWEVASRSRMPAGMPTGSSGS